MIYKKNKNRVRTYCKCLCDCGNEIVVQVDSLKSNTISCGCLTNYYRSIHNRRNEINKKFNNLLILDIDYSVKPSKAICLCDCGNIVSIAKADVVSGHTKSCGCLQKRNTSIANTKDYTNFTTFSGVKFIEKLYKNKKGVWMWKCLCPLCGKEFVALPAKILSNHTTSCGCKIQSSGERRICNILQNLKLDFKEQVMFEDCRYRGFLKFDFAIYIDKQLYCLIEFDGKQHFEPIEWFGGQKSFEKTKIRDNIKNNYCKNNNIKLIRFDYKQTDEEIKTILINTIYP